MLNRFDLRQVSPGRIINAISRRIFDLPHQAAWHLGVPAARENQERLGRFVNRHAGERCFLLGNGPSLAKMDLDLLQNQVTFGLNRIYLLRDKYPFLPTYHVCINELVLEQFSREIQSLPAPRFLNWDRRNYFDVSDPLIAFVRLSNGLADGFNPHFSSPFSSGGTVTYVALQIAFIMGFSEVILIGVDHSFVDKGIPNTVASRTSEADANHFHPNYFPKGSKWQLPDLKRSEQAYALARAYFESHGRRITDATRDGKCQVFEKAEFESLF
jgi:hypothetical protein